MQSGYRTGHRLNKLNIKYDLVIGLQKFISVLKYLACFARVHQCLIYRRRTLGLNAHHFILRLRIPFIVHIYPIRCCGVDSF